MTIDINDTSWRDCPQIFANGMFYGVNNSITLPAQIEGIDFNHKSFIMERANFTVKKTTLVARRISDMTLQELKDCPYLVDVFYEYYKDTDGVDDEERKIYLINRLKNLIDRLDVILYVCSVGVYPFDQDHIKPATIELMNKETHLDSPTVIDKQTLSNYYEQQ